MGELLRELKAAYGEDAEFREGQEEAIQGVLDGKRDGGRAWSIFLRPK